MRGIKYQKVPFSQFFAIYHKYKATATNRARKKIAKKYLLVKAFFVSIEECVDEPYMVEM
jgi:hypothetical protein